MFSTIWVKKDNLIRLVDAVSANQEGLICDKPRIVYNDELFLFGFDKYFSIPKGEHLPVCWAVDRRYFYKGDLIATVKSGDIFSKPTFDIDNSKHKTLRKIDINKLKRRRRFWKTRARIMLRKYSIVERNILTLLLFHLAAGKTLRWF